MAIDTAEKRFSLHAYSGGDSALCLRLDFPTSGVNAADRSHFLGRYRGIAMAGAASWATISGPWLYTAANHTSIVDVFNEMDLIATSGTVRGRLFDITAGAPVTGSEISHTSATEARVRSADVFANLITAHEYVHQVSKDAGSSGTWKGRRIVIVEGAGGGGGSSNSFETIACPSGTNPVADSATDTLTLVAGANITITGDATTDTITIAATGASYTDEQAQDAVGAMLDASLTYVDATPLLQRAALTGDVTASAGSNATTIANNVVSNAKLADVATSTIKGRITAATGDPEDLTAAQVRTIINVADGANNYVHPNHSGDVTSVADGAQTIAANAVTTTKIIDDAVTYAKMQNVSATDKVLGRSTAGAGNVEEIACTAAGRALIDDADAAAQRTTLGLGTVATESTVPISKGGTGQTAQQAAIDALTNVSAATNEHVLTKDTATGNAIFKVGGAGSSPPFIDSTAIIKGSADATKLVAIEADTNVPTATTVTLVVPAMAPAVSATLGLVTDIQIFTVGGGTTWTKPPGAKTVQIVMIGGGGGGGSGKRNTSGAIRAGGQGGGGGGVYVHTFDASQFGATETVTVGAGGAGGAAQTGTGNGNNGTVGGTSLFGGHLSVDGGARGFGGTTAGSSSGFGVGGRSSCEGISFSAAGNGAAGGITTSVPGAPPINVGVILPRGGGGGGGMPSADTAVAGGNGAPQSGSYPSLSAGAGGSAGGGAGGVGTGTTANRPFGGASGGGGGSRITAGAAGTGGAGGIYGAGGGGGGACNLTATSSGAGGAGADGIVVVRSYC